MKKSLYLALILTLIFNMTSIAFANNEIDVSEQLKISEERAKTIATSFAKNMWSIKLLNEDDLKTSLFTSKISNREFWSLSWHIDHEEMDLYIDIFIDANTGIIVDAMYDTYNMDQTDKNEPLTVLHESVAREMADKFFKKASPSQYKNYKYTSFTYETNTYSNSLEYNYYYDRYFNGILVADNYTFIAVDALTNQVIRYKSYWDPTPITKISSKINKYNADKLFRESLDLYLRQSTTKDYTDNPQVPTYKDLYSYTTRSTKAFAIDAEKGVLIDKYGNEIASSNYIDITEDEKDEIFNHAKEIVNNTKVSKEEATKTMSKYLKTLYGTSFEIKEVKYTEEDYSSHKLWKCDFILSKAGKDIEGIMAINAINKVLYITYIATNDDSFKANDEQGFNECYKKAISLIAEFYPSKIKDINTKLNKNKYLTGEFIFNRVVNGFALDENGIGVYFDPDDLSVLGLVLSWPYKEIISTDNIISKKEAEDLYIADHQYVPAYTKINTSRDSNTTKYEYKLLYSLPANYYTNNIINAETGDILTQHGYQPYSAEVEFNQNITKYQAVKMIRLACNYSYNYYDYTKVSFADITSDNEYYEDIKTAVKYGIVENNEDNFNGEQEINRIELAEMLTRALGYNELVKLNIYNNPFSDSSLIGKDKLGYAVICDAMGFIKSENKKFNPQATVTDLDMAKTMCYLKNYIELLH